MATTLNVVKTLTLRGTVEGVAEAEKRVLALDGAIEGLTVSTEQLTNKTLSVEAALKKALSQYDQTYRAQQKLAQLQQTLNAGLAQGLITQQQAAKVMQNAIVQHNTLTPAVNNYANSTKQARYELLNLSRQLQDVGVGLASGQSLFTVAIQQGTQISDVFATAAASGRSFGKDALAFITPYFSVARVAIGGFSTALITGLAALNSYVSAQLELKRALVGVGSAQGVTIGGLNQAATQGASPLGLSINEARQFASVLAATGKVGQTEIAAMVKLGQQFADVIGTDSVEAAKMLAEALADPVRGADTLNARLGFMDAAQKRQIQNLTEQNRIAEAQQVIINGIADSTKRASDLTGFWSLAWRGLSNFVSDYWSKLGEILSRTTGIGQSLEQQLKAANDRLFELQQKAARPPSGGPSLTKDIFSGIGTERTPPGANTAEIDEATAAVNKLTDALIEQQKQAAKTAANMDTLKESSAALQFLPEIEQVNKLNNAQILLAKVLDEVNNSEGAAQEVLARLGISYEQLVAAVTRAQGAFQTFIPDAQKAAEQLELQVKFLDRVGPAARAAQAAEQKRLELAGTANAKTLEGQRQIDAAAKIAAGGQTAQIELDNRRIALLGNLATVEEKVRAKTNEITLANFAEVGIGKELQKQLEEITRLREIESRAQAKVGALGDAATAMEKYDAAIKKANADKADQILTEDEFQRKLTSINPVITATREALTQLGSDLAAAFIDGKNAADALHDSLINIAKTASSDAIRNLLKGDIIGAGISAAVAGISFLGSKIFGGGNAEEEQKALDLQQQMTQQLIQSNDATRGFVDQLKKLNETAKGSTLALRNAESVRDQAIAAAHVQQNIAVAGFQQGAIPFAQAIQAFSAAGHAIEEAGQQFDEFRKNTIEAMNRTLQSGINSATGRDFLNSFQSVMDTFRDASQIGADSGLAQRFLQTQAQQLVDQQKLVGENFRLLLDTFPELNGLIHEFSEVVSVAVRSVDELRRTSESLDDRMLAASVDASTLEGALALFDQKALRERQAEIAAGGELITQLEAVQAQERLNVIEDFNKKALELEKERVQSIEDYLNSLLVGPESLLSPKKQLELAQAQFDAQLASAQAGNLEALQTIAATAETLRKAGLSVFGSAAGYQAVLQAIQTGLGSLIPHASGGWLSGGIPWKDSVMLAAGGHIGMPGEYVVQRPVAQANASSLMMLNSTGRWPANDNVSSELARMGAALTAILSRIAELQAQGIDRIKENTQATLSQTDSLNREQRFASRKRA